MAEHESAADTPAARITRFEQRTMDLLDENQQLRAELAAANERVAKAEARLAKLRKEHRDAYLVVMEERDDARNAMRIERAEAAVLAPAAMNVDLRAIIEHFLGAYAEDLDDTVVEAIGTRVMTVGNLRDIVAVLRDATQDGRSATETGDGRSRVSVDAANSSATAAGLSAMTAERLAEIERRFGIGRSNLTAGTKQELMLVVHELIAEVRRQRKAGQ